MELILWKDFSKRKNSTKIPTTEGTTFDIVLKEDTDMENPVIVLEPVDLGYTYAKFNNNYYFVDSEIVLTKNLMQLSLSMDSLASNKAAIGNTNAFIVYSSTGYDPMKVDNRIGVSTEKVVNASAAMGFPGMNRDGCYVLSVANATGGITGFASHYIMNTDDLSNLCTELMNTDWTSSFTKLFNDPFQSIISLVWTPFSYTALQPYCFAKDTVYVGDKSLNTRAFRLQYATLPSADVGSIELAIGKEYDDFRQMQPYTSLSLFVPFYGYIDLNAADFVNYDRVIIDPSYDITTGDVLLVIKTPDDFICQTINFNVAVNYPLAQAVSDAKGGVVSIAGAAGGVLTLAGSLASENIIGAVGSAGAIVLGAANAAMSFNSRSVSVKGSIQGRSWRQDYNPVAQLFTVNQVTEDPDDSSYIARQGRPVMHYGTISAHPGYVQCANASFAGSVLSSERDEINSYLNSGFYYE